MLRRYRYLAQRFGGFTSRSWALDVPISQMYGFLQSCQKFLERNSPVIQNFSTLSETQIVNALSKDTVVSERNESFRHIEHEISQSSFPFSALRSLESDMVTLQNLYRSLCENTNAISNMQNFTNRLLECHYDKCTIYVSGIGKSGIVARRLASTLSSISIRSQWIHGAEWTHGELGSLKKGDVVVLFSHSGTTPELIPLPPMFQRLGCDVMTIIGDEKSPLGFQSNYVLSAEATDNFLCPVPSRSIIVQEAISNAIVEFMIDAVESRAEKFRENHPGGSLGNQFQTKSDE